eukprot:1178296-Prorocentrum_minimum.AAC.2
MARSFAHRNRFAGLFNSASRSSGRGAGRALDRLGHLTQGGVMPSQIPVNRMGAVAGDIRVGYPPRAERGECEARAGASERAAEHGVHQGAPMAAPWRAHSKCHKSLGFSERSTLRP